MEQEFKRKRCKACGAPVRPGVKKCPHCGRRHGGRHLLLVSAAFLALACLGAFLYLGLWREHRPPQPSAAAAGVIQLPIPEFAASESMRQEPPETRPAPTVAMKPPIVRPEPPASPPRSRRLYVQAEGLNVRRGPGVDRSVIRQVYRGQELTELDRRSGWVKVRVDGTGMVGWVYSPYVDPELR